MNRCLNSVPNMDPFNLFYLPQRPQRTQRGNRCSRHEQFLPSLCSYRSLEEVQYPSCPLAPFLCALCVPCGRQYNRCAFNLFYLPQRPQRTQRGNRCSRHEQFLPSLCSYRSLEEVQYPSCSLAPFLCALCVPCGRQYKRCARVRNSIDILQDASACAEGRSVLSFDVEGLQQKECMYERYF